MQMPWRRHHAKFPAGRRRFAHFCRTPTPLQQSIKHQQDTRHVRGRGRAGAALLRAAEARERALAAACRVCMPALKTRSAPGETGALGPAAATAAAAACQRPEMLPPLPVPCRLQLCIEACALTTQRLNQKQQRQQQGAAMNGGPGLRRTEAKAFFGEQGCRSSSVSCMASFV